MAQGQPRGRTAGVRASGKPDRPVSDWTQLSATASADPLPTPGNENSIAEHYQRCRNLGIRIASCFGVEDPEAVFHDAYASVFKHPNSDAKTWAYLPKRIKDRAKSAYRSQATRSVRLRTVPIHESRAKEIECAPGELELPWLAEPWRVLLHRLTDHDLQAVVLFHFLGWTIDQIASAKICGSTNSAVKTRLSRVREKIRSYSFRPQPSSD